MAVRIVESVPSGSLAWHRFVRLVAVLLGLVLVVVGLIAAVYPFMLVLFAMLSLAGGDGLPEMAGSDMRALAITSVLALLSIWLGLRFIRGRRRLGLYLRKFGFEGTTRTVSQALRSAVGRSVRLVTLDDSVTAPIGVGPARRLAPVILVVAVLCGGLLVVQFAQGAFTIDASEVIAQATEDVGDSPADQIGAAFGGALVYGMIQGILWALVITLISMAAVIALFAWRAHRKASNAGRRATRALASQHDVRPAARDLTTIAKLIFAPRLMVVSVPTAFWREAISGFAEVADLVVIDVSQPTDALIWEVQSLKARFHHRWVLVGERRHVAALANAPAGTAAGYLAQLLDGEEILAYGTEPTEGQRFSQALRRRLVSLGR